MRRCRNNITLTIVVSMLAIAAGCKGRLASSSGLSKDGTSRVSQSEDTIHTRRAAMSVYAYQPVRALQILDSAVIVGNLSDFEADISRARVFSSTLMKDQLDTLLHGPEGTCLDTARVIGERLLKHDSIKSNLKRQLDVLEVLINIARIQEDTTRLLQISRKYVDVCHQLGDYQETNAQKAKLSAIIISILALLTFAITVIVIITNRRIRNKNHLLAQQLADIVNYKKMYWEMKRKQEEERMQDHDQNQELTTSPDLDTLTDEQLFQYIQETIMSEKLYLDPKFERQTLMDRFHLSKERVGAIFSKGSDYARLNSYIQKLRLEYAAKLLIEQPDKSIKQIAPECGFGSPTYFSDCFRQQFGITPTDFRRDVHGQETSNAQ